MTPRSRIRIAGALALGALGTLSLLALPGCNGLELPITVTIPLTEETTITAANEPDGDVNIPLRVFCDLLSEEDLDAMIREHAGDLIADLVDITKVELHHVTVDAIGGSFDSFTQSDLSLVFLPPTPRVLLGEAEDANGLGDTYELSLEEPVDLLNDFNDGECGVPTLHLEGEQPEDDIAFDTSVTLLVYTRLTLDGAE